MPGSIKPNDHEKVRSPQRRRPQRSVSVRQRQEIQEMLPELSTNGIAAAAAPVAKPAGSVHPEE
jgi:hypothetical protein